MVAAFGHSLFSVLQGEVETASLFTAQRAIILNYTSHSREGRENQVRNLKECAAHFEELFVTLFKRMCP